MVGNRGSSFLDSKLAILDDRGNELQSNDDWYVGGDPHLAFTAPKAGDYIVQISDTYEFGNRDFSYRLIAGVYPYADRSLPAAVERGAATELELTGVNLDKVTEIVVGDAAARGEILKQESGTLKVRIAVPESAKTGVLPLYLMSNGEYAPAPLRVVVSDLHEARLETPGTREHPRSLPAGSAVTGILDRVRGTHYYSVDARKGQTLAMAVDSMKLGYALDGAIALYDSSGKQLAFQDDPARAGPRQTPDLDPYIAHTFEQDGTYLLTVRESGRRTSPRYVYRVSVQPAEPDFALEVQAPTNTLYRGRTGKVEVRVKRRNGWNAPVEVWVEGPPAGVEISRATAEPKDSVYKDACAKEQTVNGTDVELKVKVDAAAASGTFPLRISARGVMNGRTVEHSAAAVFSSNYIARLSGPLAATEQLASVTDLPPVVVDVPQNFGITVGKTDKLKVQVRRYDGGATPLKIEPDSLPKGVTLENNVLEPGAGQVELRFITAKDAKPGKHTLSFQVGEVKTPNIEINIAAAPPEARK